MVLIQVSVPDDTSPWPAKTILSTVPKSWSGERKRVVHRERAEREEGEGEKEEEERGCSADVKSCL